MQNTLYMWSHWISKNSHKVGIIIFFAKIKTLRLWNIELFTKRLGATLCVCTGSMFLATGLYDFYPSGEAAETKENIKKDKTVWLLEIK
jgi:hypothetical protein